jgi:DNA-binding NtrC family response regulator
MVEDSDDDAQLLKRELQRQGFEPDVTRVDSGPDLRSALIAHDWDVVISDHNMPGFSGDEALKLVKLFDPDLPFIVVSGPRGEEHAVGAMRAGASDFIAEGSCTACTRGERERGLRLRSEQRHRGGARGNRNGSCRNPSNSKRSAGSPAVSHDFHNLVPPS